MLGKIKIIMGSIHVASISVFLKLSKCLTAKGIHLSGHHVRFVFLNAYLMYKTIILCYILIILHPLHSISFSFKMSLEPLT